MDLIGKILHSEIVLMALFASLALWSVGLYIVWQDKRRKTA